jgi:hypothetical protein
MLTNKTWAINFANEHLDKCPWWNKKTKCCPCWFLQKHCFSNSKNKESHVKADEVPAAKLAK